MPKRTEPSTQVAQPTPVVEEDRLGMLEAFAELVSERWGYYTARRLTSKDASEKTKEVSSKARDAAKAVKDTIEKLVKTPSPQLAKYVVEKREALTEKRKAVQAARKPYNEKMKPLADAIKYCDSIAIPDSLKELGKPVVPQFNVLPVIAKAIEQSKRK